jgi:DNA-binding transcriptional ArsR family regulator
MLARLAAGEATVSQLMEPFALTQPTISKHLRVLEDAGFIERGRDAQRRPRKLVALAFKEVADWIEPFRRQWEGRFNNLDDHLATMKKKEK